MEKARKYLFILTCLTFIFGLSSCKKKWSKPAEVSFKFQLNGNSNSEPIKFTSAYLIVNKISINGDRKQSPPHIELNQTLNNSVFNFSAGSASQTVKFDIPQGTYSKLDIKYETGADQNGTSMQINGAYTDSSGNTVAIQFIFPVGDGITLTAKNSGGGNEIVLIEGHSVNANIILNPNYWFSIVSQSMLDDAEEEVISGVPTIKIDKENNDDLYEVIINRTRDGNECIFN